jgi:uncharacterized membrane protein YjgN (DUF898 family)
MDSKSTTFLVLAAFFLVVLILPELVEKGVISEATMTSKKATRFAQLMCQFFGGLAGAYVLAKVLTSMESTSHQKGN